MPEEKPENQDYRAESLAWAFDNALRERRDQRLGIEWPLEAPPETVELSRAAEAIAEKLVSAATVSGQNLCLAEAGDLLGQLMAKPEGDPLRDHALAAAIERLGQEAVQMVAQAEHRFLLFVLMGGKSALTPRAQRFLARVARCYLFGFDAECVILCRAVLDEAFMRKVPSCRSSNKHGATLSDRIKAAQQGKSPLIDPGLANLARKIKRWGDHLLHEDLTLSRSGDLPVRHRLAGLRPGPR